MNSASVWEECVKNQIPPDMRRGDTTASGHFFRNLKKKHVSKRYRGDDDEQPRYGYSLTRKHSRDAQNQPGGFSVNQVACIRLPRCSIAMQAGSEEYHHVACIDLEALNGVKALTSRFLAQYQPIEQDQNYCHFELIPEDGTVTKWLQLQEVMEGRPTQEKLPSTWAAKEQARLVAQRFAGIFAIHRCVRP